MQPNDFVHLHVHSHYSLLDGNCQVEPLLDKVTAAGQEAIALTDHGNLYGAVSFHKEARARGIKPIIGMEAYIAEGSRFERRRITRPGRRKSTYHATLLAATDEGLRNLYYLATTAFVDGFYYKPRIDRECMREHSRGLICLSGCLSGEVNQEILAGRLDEAEKVIREYQEIFGSENFYLEVMDHGIEDERIARGGMFELSDATGVPLVATNDIHYIEPEDWEAQDVALCIGTGKIHTDPQRFRMQTRELYFKTTEDMATLFADRPEAVTNTRQVADRCDAGIPQGKRYLPTFTPPEHETAEACFLRLCQEGLKARYGEITPEIAERLAHEIEVITSMGFVDYFLIVWDFIRYAREQGIPVGPGRGSAAGSIVAYALRITELDPIRYDLLFERFLNAERISMPDIDIDFCKDRRGEVISYVEKKYGRDHVAQIITFGTMKARAVIRDVGRVLDIPLIEVDRIAKKIPNGPKDSLARALQCDQEVQALYASSAQNRHLFDIALRLEGNARHASVHAAGVVISDRPLVERVPLCTSADGVTTQWPGEVLEEVGLLKMDFLGLRTLTILEEALDNIEAKSGTRPDLACIPLDDRGTYEMLSNGDAAGVFQLESDGMKDLLRRLRPDRFEDLVAVLALYRPGPLGSGMVDTYVRRKHGLEEIAYPHPSLEPILAESLGVILYQEQVMRIANVLSGFTLTDADNLRKAMGKKLPAILEKFRAQFTEGAVARRVDRRLADEVFGLIEYFAGYGFNKSHSAAYALITYQTAWLKSNHPVEYMAALLSCEMISIDKTVEYSEACRAMGVEILPPDVCHSSARFAVEDGGIRFALAAIKGVGEGAAAALATEREANGPFKDLFDLCERVETQKLNKSALEALIDAGAMDGLVGNRAQKRHVLDDAIAVGSAADRDRRSGQGSLFGGVPDDEALVPAESFELPDIPELPDQERLQREKNALGFYLTGHPLNGHRDRLLRFSTLKVADLGSREEGHQAVLGGMINAVRSVVIRKGRTAGQTMAVLRFEDFSGTTEAVVFSDLYQQVSERLVPDTILFLHGEVDRRRDEPSFRVTKLVGLEEAPLVLTRKVTLTLDAVEELDLILPAVHRLLRSHHGQTQLYFRLRTPDHGAVMIQAGEGFRVDVGGPLVSELEKILGTERVELN